MEHRFVVPGCEGRDKRGMLEESLGIGRGRRDDLAVGVPKLDVHAGGDDAARDVHDMDRNAGHQIITTLAPNSVELGAGVLHRLVPVLHLVGDEGGELAGRHVAALHAELGEALRHLRLTKGLADRAVQARYDLAR